MLGCCHKLILPFHLQNLTGVMKMIQMILGEEVCASYFKTNGILQNKMCQKKIICGYYKTEQMTKNSKASTHMQKRCVCKQIWYTKRNKTSR